MADLAVVQVIEGKGFINVGGTWLMKVSWGHESAMLELFQNRFDTVAIQQEVAFRTEPGDERLLNQKKLSLCCTYTAGDGAESKYSVADVSLDVNKKPTPKWHNMDKISGELESYPSILISTFYEHGDDKAMPQEPEIELSEDLLSRTIIIPPPTKPELLKPILIDDEYFFIGSPSSEEETHFYNLSVTVAFAENLLGLFPMESLWPPSNIPPEFRFNLLGNPICLKPSQSIENYYKIGERASAIIRSSAKSLLLYLKQSMPFLKIQFCCTEIAVGEATIPVNEHLEHSNVIDRISIEPLNISGVFPIRPLLGSGIYKTCTLQPTIGVVIALSHLPPEPTVQNLKSAQLSSVVSPDPSDIEAEAASGFSNGPQRLPGKLQEELVYATALELEVWKEEQKVLEKEKQERSRAAYLDLLNAEYRRQVAMKEAAFQRRVCRVEELEKQLEKAIQDVRRTEVENQQEKELVARLRNQLMREKAQVATEVERITENLARKHKFEMEAERRRHTDIVNELRHQIKIQAKQTLEDGKRMKKLEAELDFINRANQAG